jgi:hypothetical protein
LILILDYECNELGAYAKCFYTAVQRWICAILICIMNTMNLTNVPNFFIQVKSRLRFASNTQKPKHMPMSTDVSIIKEI